MFDIRITIGTIGYEQTMTALFPAVLEKCQGIQNPNLLLRLFLELGEDALQVLLGVMERLPEGAKQELLCQCMNAYRTVLTEKLNEYLQTDVWGRNFVIRSMYIEFTGEGLELVGEGVSVDLRALLESERTQEKIHEAAAAFIGSGSIGKIFGSCAGSMLKQAAKAVPEETEKLGLKLLQREDVKNKLMGLAQAALEKRGLDLELKSLSFLTVCDADVIQDNRAVPGTLQIPPELEEELIKALAGYLRRKIPFR
ncbi:hypothetical protein AALA00_02625 [Lachnospiraceae bacterium 46-15]